MIGNTEIESSQRSLRKVLIANRGEIARRIQRTLRQMGLSTVAVFSDADHDAAHVSEADEAVRLGPAPSLDSYLNLDAVMAAARLVGADAIHPGYGFLAENPEFAERCDREGLVFIGPSARAIRRMGDKAAAKAMAKELGIPILEGFSVDELGTDEIRSRADELGYPLLIKAIAGGGGKGMRRVHCSDELEAALASAAREAKAAFGDGSLLVEPWLDAARHVEVQVFGDHHGKVLHLFERDCSVQRRHQKVIEEAPSPAVDGDLRRRMGEAAVTLARAVDYRGAGTVEFLLDARGSFYFLEMNTRLQVEHPVTEAITGLDLVRLQVEVAQGRPLTLEQEDLQIQGHAMEARLYAEDPAREFLPSTGRICLWDVPEMAGLRMDSGIELDQEIGVHYDPMLAKLIAHGSDRPEALRRLRRAVEQLAIGGVVTNRHLLGAVLAHEVFERGEADTGFMETHLPPERRHPVADETVAELHAIAATLRLVSLRGRSSSPVPSGLPAAWRNNRWRPQEQIFVDGSEQRVVSYLSSSREPDFFHVAVSTTGTDQVLELSLDPDQLNHRARCISGHGNLWVVEIDGVRRRFHIGVHGTRHWIHGLGRISSWVAAERFPESSSTDTVGGCLAPMTGRVIEVPVQVGDRVAAGDPLVVLEAMKMEHRLTAQADGRVEAVRVEVGQMVDPDEVLVVVVADREEAV